MTDIEYYTNNGNPPTDQNWGSYQFTSLQDIVNNFELMYTGEGKLLNYVKRYEILFHAKQAIRLLAMDAIQIPKILELNITGPSNQMVFPPDYVSFIRISYEYNGLLYPLVENKQTNFSNSYLQDVNGDIVFDLSGNVIDVQSQLDISRLGGDTQRLYLGPGPYNGQMGWNIGDCWFFGRSFYRSMGRDPELMNANTAYSINKQLGVINFSSDLTGSNVVLEYVSDGLEGGADENVRINKMAENAIYAYMEYALMSGRSNIPMYEKTDAKRRKKAEIGNAKIRLRNISAVRLLPILRKQEQWIK